MDVSMAASGIRRFSGPFSTGRQVSVSRFGTVAHASHRNIVARQVKPASLLSTCSIHDGVRHSLNRAWLIQSQGLSTCPQPLPIFDLFNHRQQNTFVEPRGSAHNEADTPSRRTGASPFDRSDDFNGGHRPQRRVIVCVRRRALVRYCRRVSLPGRPCGPASSGTGSSSAHRRRT